MKGHHLLVLLTAAVVAIILVFWTGSLRESDRDNGLTGELAPGLAATVNDIERVTLAGDAESSVTLERGIDQWNIAEKGGYPADLSKIAKFLIDVSASRLLEQKTSNPESFSQLGVADPGTAEGAGVRVEISGPGGKTELIVGNSARGNTATYVRRAGEAESWLASGNLEADADALTWLDRAVINLPADRVQQVTIRQADDTVLRVFKDNREASNFSVADLPEGRELKYASIANPVASSLASLNLEDVASADGQVPEDSAQVETEYRAFDGLVVTVQTFRDGEQRFAKFDVAFDEAQAARFRLPPVRDYAEGEAPAGEDPAETDSMPDPEATDASDGDAAIREEAESLQERLAPWVFAVTTYKFDQMTRTIDDLLKEEAADEG